MLAKNNFRKLIASFTSIAVLFVSSAFSLPGSKDLTGEITVRGQVTVNGQTAVSNATILSGSTIVTGANSSAIVSLGKVGRIEIMEDSNLVLNFSENSITAILSSGKAKVANAAGVAATVTTKDATVIADSSMADNFTVEVECSHTHVDTLAGVVTMREGTSDRQIAAGTSASAGNLSQTGCKPCLRPDSAPPVRVGGWPWLLLIAAGVAGAAILLGGNDDDDGGGTIVVSPTR
ncbi:MAG: hypothetical protein IPM25_07720 [Chloracidobacterium sp.]|nr:hypothetical protein [Chloracidobacterium sp.]